MQTRFQGKFSMAGIRFFPEMKGLDTTFLQKTTGFKQVVPIFTNVIFDTTQQHSNTLFPNMFAWLDQVLELIKKHPETLFVVRAHPDEVRPGKVSRESVAMWIERTGAARLSNLIFIPPEEFFSSYELIRLSKFVMVYNSTIGLRIIHHGGFGPGSREFPFHRFWNSFLPSVRGGISHAVGGFPVKGRGQDPPRTNPKFPTLFLSPLFHCLPAFRRVPGTSSHEWLREVEKVPTSTPVCLRFAKYPRLVDGIIHDGDFLLKE